MDSREDSTNQITRRQFSVSLMAGAAWQASRLGDASAAEKAILAPIKLTCVDDQCIHSATFQSNNQKVVASRHGIFLTYLKTRNKEYTAQRWRLMHSTDDGGNFRCLYEATQATNPPVIEVDGPTNTMAVCRWSYFHNEQYSSSLFLW